MLPAQGRVTIVIAALTALVSVAAWLLSPNGMVDLYAGFVPARVGGGVTLPGALPVVLTPLSAALLHAGIVHLGFNMLMLLWCGRQVEVALGGRMMVLLYILGAYGAAIGQWAIDPAATAPMIGASGAISALVAVYALVFSEQQVRAIGPIPPHVVRALWLGAAWIGVQALMGFGFSGGGQGVMIAVGAHIGGFITGLICARPMLRMRFRRR
jgi:membrane associated rhomboid family serine protease